MAYNVDFCIISAAYLFITALFYMRQTKVASLRNSIFQTMLICGILALVLDVVAALLDPVAYRLPLWLLYAVNIVFLLTVQCSGLLFFRYVMALTGMQMRIPRRLAPLVYAPVCIVALLLIASPFTQSAIFYLDEQHVYHHGALHLALYISMAMYLAAGFGVVVARRKSLQPVKRRVIFTFLIITFLAMLIQMRFPYLLVNTTAYALSLVLIYQILEAPTKHIDAMTGVFNRTALTQLLNDQFDQNQRFTLLVHPLKALHLVNNSIGMHNGDRVICAFASSLKRKYPKCSVVRVEGDVFAVLVTGGAYMDADALSRAYAEIPRSFRVNNIDVKLDVALAAINSEDCADSAGVLSLMESVIRLHRSDRLGETLLGDSAFFERSRHDAQIVRATARALDEDRVEVWYQPIHAPDGTLRALEALVRIFDPQLGMLPTQELIELAEGNGMILALGKRILEKACAFIRDNGLSEWGLHHIGVNLSAVQCMHPRLPEMILGVQQAYGVSGSLIAFELTETALVESPEITANIDALTKAGFHFLLDDFGKGYANFKKMTELPFYCIKLDKSLLWESHDSESNMALLTGVIHVVKQLGLDIVCEGVETYEQVELMRSLSVPMLQGYYYARPLRPEALIEYAGKKVGGHAV